MPALWPVHCSDHRYKQMPESSVQADSKPYTDAKGRPRWHRNDEVAAIVKQLGEYLIIGGYPEEHAKRYAQLAHTISRMPELIDTLAENDQLNRIPGVGWHHHRLYW